jgi:hypothetical protein
MPDYVTFFRAVYWTDGASFRRISNPEHATWPDHDLLNLARDWLHKNPKDYLDTESIKIGQFMVYPCETAMGKELLLQKEVTV